MLDRLFALLQLLGRLLLELLELRLRELHEGLVVRCERIRGECLQRGAERSARLLERGHPAGVLGPQHEPGSRGADQETDDESDDHLGRRTLEMGSDGTRTDHQNAGPDEPESPSEPARRAYVRVAGKVKQKKRALCALSPERGCA